MTARSHPRPPPRRPTAPTRATSEEPEVELSPEDAAAAEAGASWLERLHEGLEGNQILTLPYGDVDVAAAADHDPAAYREARKRSSGDLQPWGLPDHTRRLLAGRLPQRSPGSS